MKNLLFIGNIPGYWTEQYLQNLLPNVGQILGIKIIRDKYSGKARGYGFIEMSDNDGLVKVINILQHTPEGRKLIIEKSKLDIVFR